MWRCPWLLEIKYVTLTDIEAAKACNINSIAVTWGFNSEKVLLQHEPHFIAIKPTDILTICETINNL